ncbi:ferrous iron transport protein A [Synergistaceae bacterium OttesenSCG-928-D05]|nr:ferrous iron transport protein A [Synergistaceae bacterium OttesenSCG-928-D05]
MPLTMAAIGEKNRIKKISGRDEMRRHLAHLGFVEGQEISVVSRHGGNVILCIKDSRIAIDETLANRIIV